MTPEEKAKELVDEYLCIEEIYNVDLFCDECGMTLDVAKYCALFTVDKILDVTKRPTYNQDNWNEITGFRYDKFWYEVKHEIEKL